MSKEEIQELKSEIKRLRNLLRLRDDPSPVSPLAPKGGFPNLPEIGGGGRNRVCAAAVHYKGRDDVMLARTSMLLRHNYLHLTSTSTPNCDIDINENKIRAPMESA